MFKLNPIAISTNPIVSFMIW